MSDKKGNKRSLGNVIKNKKNKSNSLMNKCISADRVRLRIPKKNVAKSFIWGSMHTTTQIAERLDLSYQYCNRMLSMGYIDKLKNYERKSYQIKTWDKAKIKQRTYKDNPEVEEVKKKESLYFFKEDVEDEILEEENNIFKFDITRKDIK